MIFTGGRQVLRQLLFAPSLYGWEMWSSSHPAHGKLFGKLSPGNVAMISYGERGVGWGAVCCCRQWKHGSSEVHQFDDLCHLILLISGPSHRKRYRSGLHTVITSWHHRVRANQNHCQTEMICRTLFYITVVRPESICLTSWSKTGYLKNYGQVPSKFCMNFQGPQRR